MIDQIPPCLLFYSECRSPVRTICHLAAQTTCLARCTVYEVQTGPATPAGVDRSRCAFVSKSCCNSVSLSLSLCPAQLAPALLILVSVQLSSSSISQPALAGLPLLHVYTRVYWLYIRRSLPFVLLLFPLSPSYRFPFILSILGLQHHRYCAHTHIHIPVLRFYS
jgi:hypothetical protein